MQTIRLTENENDKGGGVKLISREMEKDTGWKQLTLQTRNQCFHFPTQIQKRLKFCCSYSGKIVDLRNILQVTAKTHILFSQHAAENNSKYFLFLFLLLF